ncbi:MAG: hypothetical protein GXO80_12030 [Chlorobi bacterium]|nr:hypothetical protein [Chlorobiota bacterium]
MEKESLKIKISNDGIKPVGKSKFYGDVLTLKTFKIYIVRNDKEFIYIGKTTQQIGTKFGQGFRAFTKDKDENERISGYGGYKWIEEFEDKELNLDVIDLGDNATDEFAEAVEAEIVFQIRQRYLYWPKYQNEIHFNNNHKEAFKTAQEILELIK